MNEPLDDGLIATSKKRCSASVLKHPRLGNREPDDVPRDTDVDPGQRALVWP